MTSSLPALGADLQGRTAFVTGASRGIGAAIARRLGSVGARVAVGYRTGADAAQAVSDDIVRSGGVAVPIKGDISVEAEVDLAFRSVEQELGPVEILVNNAANHIGGRTQELLTSDWHAVLDGSLTGAFLCTRRALPCMLAGNWGRIVNVTSVVGLNGYPGDAAYASAKAGLLGLTRAVALEHARHGITVNAIAPGFVSTDLVANFGAAFHDRVTNAVPLSRFATPLEVADAVVLLLAGAYTTGATLVVDGGWSLAAALK